MGCPRNGKFGFEGEAFKERLRARREAGWQGLKPRTISAANAALKRRSSTVLLAPVVLDTSKTSGAKALDLIWCSHGTATAVP